MIKLIVFDLDGVLIDSRDIHYKALNLALSSIDDKYVIKRDEHLSTFDGLSTKNKLKLLTEQKGLPSEYYDIIWQKKQIYTWEIIKTDFKRDNRIIEILIKLKKKGYKIYVASNSVRKTIFLSLLKKEFLYFIDYFISNEEVNKPKPNPEIYFRCMIHAGVGVKETIIIEDSHIGRESAVNSGAYLLPVKDLYDYDLKKIEDFINNMTTTSLKQKWMGKLNVVIPMAGRGSRFEETGLYTFPKPLIDVNGKPMIQVVVENLNFDLKETQFIYICQKEHVEKYNLFHLLKLITPFCKIIEVDGVTEGAVCSILMAKEYINNDIQLVLANSDQFMEWNSNVFMYSMQDKEIDGGIVTFENTHPKWSYAKLGDDFFVSEVAEKKPISTHATTGIYFWKKGSEFVKYAENMISKNIRVNNEFYTCPVFNEAILDNKKIKIFPITKMWGLGVPEDLEYYLKNYK